MSGAEGGRPTPLVSVVLPVRNAAPHLDEALASVAAQTLHDIEVIVVDDGSTDATHGIVARWAADDERVRAVAQPARGIVAALERGRAEARGQYIARMDADDVSEPRRLEAQLDLLRSRPELAGCGCGVRYFPDELVRDGARRYERWINGLVDPTEIDAEIFVECPLPHPTFFMRAAALDAVGGYRESGGPEDYELVLRMWARGHRFGKVPDVLLHWREGADRLSRIDPRYSQEAFLSLKVEYLRRTLLVPGEVGTARRRLGVDAEPQLPAPQPAGSNPSGPQPSELRGVVIWGAGPVGKALSRALQDAGVAVVAFVDLDPRKIGQEIHDAPVLDTAGGLAIGSGDRRGVDPRAREADRRSPLHLAAVGQEGARQRITDLLKTAGKRPLRDFVAVA